MTKTTFPKKSKAVFISIRYPKTFPTQDVKSQRTERSVRKIAQSIRDSAFEQKLRIVSSGEIWGSSQNCFFSYNQSNKPARGQKVFFGTYSTSLWKVSVLLKRKKAVFISIRHHKTSQTQDVKSQSTKPSLRKLAQPKRDSAFEQKHVSFQVERPQEVLKTVFLVTTKEKNKAEHKQTILERTQRSFCKVGVFFSVISPNIFSEGLHENHQNNCIQYKTTKSTFPKKSKAVFISIRYPKTSPTQDVKSQRTERSVRKIAQSIRDSAFEQKLRLFQVERSEEVLKTAFLVTIKATSPPEVKKSFLERTQRRCGKFLFCSSEKKLFL